MEHVQVLLGRTPRLGLIPNVLTKVIQGDEQALLIELTDGSKPLLQCVAGNEAGRRPT